MAQKDSPEALEEAFKATPLHESLVTFLAEHSTTNLTSVTSGYGSFTTNTQYRKIQEYEPN